LQILAAVACGEFKSVEAAANQLVKVIDTIEPEQDVAKKYEIQYNKFIQIYPTVKDLFKIL